MKELLYVVVLVLVISMCFLAMVFTGEAYILFIALVGIIGLSSIFLLNKL